MKRLLIAGAGGFGREMYAAALESTGFGRDFGAVAFLDSDPLALSRFDGYPPVVGDPDTFAPGPGDVFVTALGDIAARRAVAKSLESRGAEFVSIVHRSARVGRNVAIGRGSFVAAGAVLTVDVSVGEHTCVFQNSVVGHDVRIGDFAHVYSLCALGGGVEICDGASVYPGSAIAPRRRIGKNAVVGAGSAVFTDVPDGGRVLGNPAAPLE